MKARFFVIHCLSVAILLASSSQSAAEVPGGLKAGAARIDITPEKPVKMSGYGSRKDLSTGVHDPLSARVLAFEEGDRRFVLISTDVLGFYGGTADYLRNALLEEFQLQPSELFLAAIHTHAGPSLTIDKERDHPNNVEYTESLKGKLIEVVRQAMGRMQPVKIGWGAGACPVGANRRELRIGDDGKPSIALGRNPEGPTDKEVLVMKVARADGTPIAVAFDYATHGTSLGPGNLVISGDVPGLAEQFVEKILGAETVVPAFIGASGNIDPWFRVLPAFNEEPGWIPEPVLLGTFLGEEVVRVCRAIQATTVVDQIATNLVTREEIRDDALYDLRGSTGRRGLRRSRWRGLHGNRPGDQGGFAVQAHVRRHSLQRRRGLPGAERSPRAGGLRGHEQPLRPAGGRHRHPRVDPSAARPMIAGRRVAVRSDAVCVKVPWGGKVLWQLGDASQRKPEARISKSETSSNGRNPKFKTGTLRRGGPRPRFGH